MLGGREMFADPFRLEAFKRVSTVESQLSKVAKGMLNGLRND